MNHPEWDKRIARAKELTTEYPFASELLNFYAQVAQFQRDVYDQAAQHSVRRIASCSSIREQLDLIFVAQQLPALFSLAERNGPPGLAQAARALTQESPDQWMEMLAAYTRGDEQRGTPAEFFCRACVQPYAEYCGRSCEIQLSDYTGSRCPLCNGRPQVAVLRPEGEGAKRSLICSFCLLEWSFRRIVCPACGEQDPYQLPRYSAPEFPHVRVEACDACKRYLKSVDLTVCGFAVPIVDEIAAAPLDLWAGEHGYSKLELDLMGG